MLKKTVTLIFAILVLVLNSGRTESRICKQDAADSYRSFYIESEKRLTRVKDRACRQGWYKKGGYRIYIVYNPEPNAISYSNQVVLINSGLMSAIKSDEELELILWLLIIESSC